MTVIHLLPLISQIHSSLPCLWCWTISLLSAGSVLSPVSRRYKRDTSDGREPSTDSLCFSLASVGCLVGMQDTQWISYSAAPLWVASMQVPKVPPLASQWVQQHSLYWPHPTCCLTLVDCQQFQKHPLPPVSWWVSLIPSGNRQPIAPWLQA